MKCIKILILAILIITLVEPVIGGSQADENGSGPVNLVNPTYNNYFYFFNHGNAAQVELTYPNRGYIQSWNYRDYGAELYMQDCDTTVKIQLPITGIASYNSNHPKVRYLAVRLATQSSPGIEINHYWVRNGEKLIADVGGISWRSTTTGTYVDYSIDLGGYYDMVRGCNIVLQAHDPYNGCVNSNWLIIAGYGNKEEW